MKALILGAGYGVRLYPLTQNTPKPLLLVNNKPVIERGLEQIWPIEEIKEIFVVVNHRFYEHYNQWLTDYKQRSPILSRRSKQIILCDDGSISVDDRLGAIGDINFVIKKKRIKDDLLIMAGDNIFTFPLQEFIQFFNKHGTSIALKNMKGIKRDKLSQYGVATLDKNKRIIDFEEKPPLPKSSIVAICLYLFPKDQLPLIEEYLKSGFNPDAPGYYIQWLYKRIPVYGWQVKGDWFDIGDIDSYNKANKYFFQKERKSA